MRQHTIDQDKILKSEKWLIGRSFELPGLTY